MDTKSGAEVTEALKALLNPSALEDVLACAVAHDHPCQKNGPKTALLHVRFSEDEPQVAALADFLWRQCMYYALPRKRRLEYQKGIAADFSLVAQSSSGSPRRLHYLQPEIPVAGERGR